MRELIWMGVFAEISSVVLCEHGCIFALSFTPFHPTTERAELHESSELHETAEETADYVLIIAMFVDARGLHVADRRCLIVAVT